MLGLFLDRLEDAVDPQNQDRLSTKEQYCYLECSQTQPTRLDTVVRGILLWRYAPV